MIAEDGTRDLAASNDLKLSPRHSKPSMLNLRKKSRGVRVNRAVPAAKGSACRKAEIHCGPKLRQPHQTRTSVPVTLTSVLGSHI